MNRPGGESDLLWRNQDQSDIDEIEANTENDAKKIVLHQFSSEKILFALKLTSCLES